MGADEIAVAGLEAVNRLRAFVARGVEREDPDGPWAFAALQAYAAGARYGLTLEQAFRIALGHGARPWWQLEALKQRDELLRGIRERHFPGIADRQAAGAIARGISRYEGGRWRSDRVNLEPPEGLRGEYFRLLKLEVPLSAPTIRRALGGGSRESASREPDVA